MASGTAGRIAPDAIPIGKYTPLNRQQIVGFWAAWFGWMLDGMDSVIYALVLGPALTELLPRHGVTDIHGGGCSSSACSAATSRSLACGCRSCSAPKRARPGSPSAPR